jgi:hypothetical protein
MTKKVLIGAIAVVLCVHLQRADACMEVKYTPVKMPSEKEIRRRLLPFVGLQDFIQVSNLPAKLADKKIIPATLPAIIDLAAMAYLKTIGNELDIASKIYHDQWEAAELGFHRGDLVHVLLWDHPVAARCVTTNDLSGDFLFGEGFFG